KLPEKIGERINLIRKKKKVKTHEKKNEFSLKNYEQKIFYKIFHSFYLKLGQIPFCRKNQLLFLLLPLKHLLKLNYPT
ncbi:hypothetical protein NQ788_11140, partial [Acinetobacter baumannii]|nr:hypothetical protein [Acinetobacter baumannii]